MTDELFNQVVVPLIDQRGIKVDERELVNTPIAELYPDESFVIIDWTAAVGRRPEVDDLAPVPYNGQMFDGTYAWGSAVKTGQTIGLTHDLGVEANMLRGAEDGQRVGRWLLAQGWYGGLVGEYKIRVAQRGEHIEGIGVVEDGFGYIRRDLAESGYNERTKIQLGRAKGSYTFWQRVRPWSPELEDELLPAITERLIEASDVTNVLYEQASTFDDKKLLVDLDERMIEHPFVANALSRASAEYFSRLATTANVDSWMGVVVPTEVDKVCWPGHGGKLELHRYPIDSDGSLQAVDTSDEDQDVYQRESGRIGELEVVQVSISSRNFHSKGCLGVVDEIPGGYDIIICADDIKMASNGVAKLRKRKRLVIDGVVAFTQWFGKGSAIGVNPKWAKDLMGLDHDGDMVEIIDCNTLPVLWETVAALPPGETKKLKKIKSPLKERPAMIVKSMSNLVGFASNIMSATFMVSNRELLAKQLGFKSEAAMDSLLNFHVKVGTDGFKTNIDTRPIEKHMGVLQGNLRRLFGVMAPWSDWPNDWAFRHGIPQVSSGKGLDEIEATNAVKPFMDGTVAQIARHTLPALKDILETPIKVRLLTDFRDWALPVTKELIGQAKDVQAWYNANVRRCNWSDPESIQTFKARLAQEIELWLAEGVDKKLAASALWRVAHSARSEHAGAASAFIAFPEESVWIVSDKPGLSASKATILTGLHYQLPGVSELEAQVQVVAIETERNGKRVIRKAIVGSVPGQVEPRDPKLPCNLLAFVAMNADQPEVGEYHARITQITKSAWQAVLA